MKKDSCFTNCNVFRNNFGDPSESRNFTISKASGKYIALIDGDDIYSPNWLADGYEILRKSKTPIILHTEYDVTFGYDELSPRIWKMKDSYSLSEDYLILFSRNRWSAGTILAKEIAIEHPYKASRRGYGYEDWTFNVETRFDGIEHKVVPGSVKFYRIRNESTYHSHTAGKVVTEYMDAYSVKNTQNYLNSVDISNVVKPPISSDQLSPIREIISGMYHISKRVPGVKNVVMKRLDQVNINIAERKMAAIPKPVRKAYEELNDIDSEIYMARWKANDIHYYDSELDFLGKAYLRMIRQITADIDYLFLPQPLSVGGTEKVIVNYLKIFAEQHPDWHIAVFAGISREAYDIPENVDIVDYWKEVKYLGDWDRDFLLSRLIVQCKVKRLHLLHNDLGMRWIKDHAELVQTNKIPVYVSQFMYEYFPDPSIKVGLIDPYLREIFPVVTKVFTDNEWIKNEMIRLEGFDKEKISNHYQPVEIDARPVKDHPTVPGKLRILWASRVNVQKRPDILVKIADKLDPEIFNIDVYGRVQAPPTAEIFKGHKNIHFHGSYKGIKALNTDDYDLFLYTSQCDGLPNVLLEMAQRGLPIVASRVGGIADLINEDTGYLVDVEDIDGYVKAIEGIQTEYSKAVKRAKNAQALINKRHTWSKLKKKCGEDIK